jgi:hypothetical protein
MSQLKWKSKKQNPLCIYGDGSVGSSPPPGSPVEYTDLRLTRILNKLYEEGRIGKPTLLRGKS